MGSLILVGGTPADGVVVAGALGSVAGSARFNGAPTDTAGDLTTGGFLLGVAVDWFPDPTGSWHLGGAIGLGGFSAEDEDDVTYAGIAPTGWIFGGYDAWIGPEFSLSVMGFGSYSPSAKARDEDGEETGYSFAGASAGIMGGILFH
jgi:hypothetical protein